MKCRYALVDVDRTCDPMIVFIEDLDGPKSVTNDAENVMRSIREQYRNYDRNYATRVVYKDTSGEWWEMYYHEGRNNLQRYVEFKQWHGKVWDTLSN